MKNTNPPANKQEEPTNTLPATTKNPEFDRLLALDKIERSDLESLPPAQRKEFTDLLNHKLQTTTDAERDLFIDKISGFVEQDKLWELNHTRISYAIKNHIHKYGSMPNKSQVAKETGLSRKTVHKHMETITTSPLAKEQKEIFSLMTSNVISKVMQSALNGDTGAAKLYLNTIDKANGPAGKDIVINNQNNYIQINNTVLNQQVIQKLKPEQLQKIEDIIKASLEQEGQG